MGLGNGRAGDEATARGLGLDNHQDAQHWLCYRKPTGVFDDNFSGTRMPFVCE